MNKTDIAGFLLINTSRDNLIALITEYISVIKASEPKEPIFQNNVLEKFDCCVAYIKKCRFDASKWGLFEVPIEYAYVFSNKEDNLMFDLVVFSKDDISPQFLDENHCEVRVSSIEEAIRCYYD